MNQRVPFFIQAIYVYIFPCQHRKKTRAAGGGELPTDAAAAPAAATMYY